MFNARSSLGLHMYVCIVLYKHFAATKIYKKKKIMDDQKSLKQKSKKKTNTNTNKNKNKKRIKTLQFVFKSQVFCWFFFSNFFFSRILFRAKLKMKSSLCCTYNICGTDRLTHSTYKYSNMHKLRHVRCK